MCVLGRLFRGLRLGLRGSGRAWIVLFRSCAPGGVSGSWGVEGSGGADHGCKGFGGEEEVDVLGFNMLLMNLEVSLSKSRRIVFPAISFLSQLLSTLTTIQPPQNSQTREKTAKMLVCTSIYQPHTPISHISTNKTSSLSQLRHRTNRLPQQRRRTTQPPRMPLLVSNQLNPLPFPLPPSLPQTRPATHSLFHPKTNQPKN